jgi:sec-independent protein translocase protein TatA
MHLLVILVIVLIIFGRGKLPQIGAGIGKSIREFKKALSDSEGHTDRERKEDVQSEKTGKHITI